MSRLNLYREYRLKAYLNMNHYITINGKPGQVHPHTWEFVVVTIVAGDEFVEFRTFENAIEHFLELYQNHVMNEIPPFDVVNPTIENVTDYFAQEIAQRLDALGGKLVSLEGSETPTRSYIVSNRNEAKFVEDIGGLEKDRVSAVIDIVVETLKENL